MYVRSHSFPFLPGKVHDFSLTRSRKKKKKSPSPSLHSGHGKCLSEATKCHFTSSGQLYCHIPLPGCTAFMLPWAHNDFTLQSLFFLLFFFYPSVSPQPHHSGGGEDLGRVLSCKLSLERRVARKRGVGSKHKAVVLFIPVT